MFCGFTGVIANFFCGFIGVTHTTLKLERFFELILEMKRSKVGEIGQGQLEAPQTICDVINRTADVDTESVRLRLPAIRIFLGLEINSDVVLATRWHQKPNVTSSVDRPLSVSHLRSMRSLK